MNPTSDGPEPQSDPYPTPQSAQPYPAPFYPPEGQWSGQYGTGQYGAGQYGADSYGTPANTTFGAPQPHSQPYAPAQPAPRRRRAAALATVGAIVAGALVGGGGVAAFEALDHHTTTGTGTAQGGLFPGNGQSGNGQTGNGQTGNGQTGTTSQSQASAAQQVGVVDIETVVNFGEGEAAGTGLVIASDGYILTNNHVVNQSTTIKVIVVSTGKSYRGTVVGTDPTDDIAVVKLSGATGLATARLGDSSSVKVGDAVTGVGNAGGVGGTPSAARGTITALDQTITASDSDGSNAERLDGLFETNAQIQAGDSGGPLYNASQSVIGIDTAAETSRASSSTVAGYAIPINDAVAIAKRITSGEDSSTIHQGYPAFLGVALTSEASTTLGSVVGGGPAATAGLAAGDTITRVGPTAVSTGTALKSALAKYNPGDKISLTWRTAAGASRTATVTLTTGPAD